MSMLSLIWIGLLVHIKSNRAEGSEECRAAFSSDIPVYPLGVCVQIRVSEDVTTSNKMECKDDEAVFKVYVTDDCSLTSTTQDSPVAFDDVVCDTDLNRCAFAIVRAYTDTAAECAKTSETPYLETASIVNVCVPNESSGTSVKNECTDDKIISKTYGSSTSCEGDSTESTVSSTGCTAGTYTEIVTCNMDQAMAPYVTLSVLFTFVMSFIVN
eukprot:601775_1